MALLGLTFASCAALPGGGPAPLDTFELSAPLLKAHGQSRRQILIAQPSALKALDSQNIVIKPSDRSIQFLKGAQWADRLPLVGRLPGSERVWVSAGYSGHGNVLGLACGELLAEAILGAPEPELELFDPARLLRG